MEAEGDGNAQVGRRVRERAVERLPVDDGHVPGCAYERHCPRELLAAAVLGDQPLDVDAPLLVGAGITHRALPAVVG